jgi:glycolate oxidase
VRLSKLPEKVATLLAIFNTVDDAADAVVAITADGITPAALEMLDGWTLRVVEEATHAGYPKDSGAVLLIEIEGLREQVEEQAAAASEICMRVKAREVRRAKDERECNLLWSGRKNAFGAIGRISPSYYVQDGVIPRTKIPQTLRHIAEVAQKYSLTIGNIFHAGDGNLHPLILFDPRDEEQTRRTLAAGKEILQYCVELGGSITGEHGVGMEKNEQMPMLFSENDLEVMERLRNAFNPDGLLNPEKILPSPRTCKEVLTPKFPGVIEGASA